MINFIEYATSIITTYVCIFSYADRFVLANVQSNYSTSAWFEIDIAGVMSSFWDFADLT